MKSELFEACLKATEILRSTGPLGLSDIKRQALDVLDKAISNAVKNKPRVVIDVNGGVAEVNEEESDSSIIVDIRDHDNEKHQ